MSSIAALKCRAKVNRRSAAKATQPMHKSWVFTRLFEKQKGVSNGL